MRRVAALVACILATLTLAGAARSVTLRAPGAPAWTAASLGRSNISYSIWIVTADRVELSFLVPAWEAEYVTGRAPYMVVQQRLSGYLLHHAVVTASGRECPAEDQGYGIGQIDPVSVGAGLYGFEIFFRCPTARAVVLTDSALFDRMPDHVSFAQVQINGRSHQEVFSAANTRLRLPPSGALRSAPMSRYLSHGLSYALQHLDVACFLIGSLMLLARGRDLLWLGAGLAGGLLLALGAALTANIAPRSPELLGAFIGFLVALPAARHVTRSLRRPDLGAPGAMALLFLLSSAALFFDRVDAAVLLAGAALVGGGVLALSARLPANPCWLVIPASLLGLLEGLTLAQELAPLHLPAATRLPMLGGFDAGLFTGDAVLLLCAAAVYRAVKMTWQRWGSFNAPVVSDLTAAVVGGLGMFWLVSRPYG